MRARGPVALQLRELPDGTQFELKAVNPPKVN